MKKFSDSEFLQRTSVNVVRLFNFLGIKGRQSIGLNETISPTIDFRTTLGHDGMEKISNAVLAPLSTIPTSIVLPIITVPQSESWEVPVYAISSAVPVNSSVSLQLGILIHGFGVTDFIALGGDETVTIGATGSGFVATGNASTLAPLFLPAGSTIAALVNYTHPVGALFVNFRGLKRVLEP